MAEAAAIVRRVASIASLIDPCAEVVSKSKDPASSANSMPRYSTPTQESALSILEMLERSYADRARGDSFDPTHALLGMLSQLPNEAQTMLPDLPSWAPDWAERWSDLIRCTPTPSPPPPPYSLFSVLTPEQFLPISVIEPDLDVSAVFDILRSMDIPECCTEPWYDISPSILLQQSEAKRDTHVWASHLFETSVKADEKRTDSAAGDYRNRACHVFKRMLDTNNPHILSGLIHVSCVISGLGGDDFYRSILRDCCDIIDQSKNQVYALLYRYALACEDGNQDTVKKLGRQLLQSTEQNGFDSKKSSINFLVYQQFRAHHLLEYMQDTEEARDILQRCLSESSRYLERDHSINVNCLNLLGRAYERLGQYQAAIDTYFDALQRSQVVFWSGHPYRMRILRSIALLQARLGMIHETEQNLREVFWNRAQLLGPGHEFTFSSERELQEFLICHGRQGEAIQLSEAREALYHDDRHWKMLSDQEALKIRREGRNKGLYWEKPQALFKYAFVMPKEACMRPGTLHAV